MYLIVAVLDNSRHLFLTSTELATEALAYYHAAIVAYPGALVIDEGETLDATELKRHVDAEIAVMEAIKHASTLH